MTVLGLKYQGYGTSVQELTGTLSKKLAVHLQANVQETRIKELEELNKSPYWSMEDVRERIKQLKKGTER